MRAIFYAPIADPDASAASGVQRMGVLLQRALTAAGVDVRTPRLPRTYEGKGDAAAQRALREQSEAAANALLAAIREGREPKPDIWFSYHVYYKSPDWIGPRVAAALRIPYLIAEGSHAPKRAGGPWSLGHDGTTAALKAADRLLAMTRFDRVCLEWIAKDRVRDLKPFIDTHSPSPLRGGVGVGVPLTPHSTDLQRPRDCAAPTPTPTPPRTGEGEPSARLIAVGMMRNERKRASYELLAQSLGRLNDIRLQLTIFGDGAFRPNIEEIFQQAVQMHDVRFAGAVTPERIPELLAEADIFAWPGLGEAYGLVFLEAQAESLPVVACRDRGVPDATRDGETALLSEPGDINGYAANLRRLVTDNALRTQFGEAGRKFVQTERSVDAAARTLRSIISELGVA